MALKEPSEEQIRELAAHFGFDMGPEDVAEFRDMVAGGLAMYRPLESLPDNVPAIEYPRSPGRFPTAEEDPLHAWYVKTSVKGAADGKLAGRQVVLKDTICLAGVPMMDGSSTLEGYVPDVDATVVTRILDAGGEIVGKANCEFFCYSAGSNTNATGPTRNPHRPTHTSGGSSSGCAAIVGSGEVAMALGGDQGGSIRTPSAFSGVYGMKATHGLVPYTGIFPTEHTVDHIGPMTSGVADNALLLEVVAGHDGLDPRQYAPVVHPYTEFLDRGVDGLRIGVLAEGFGQAASEPDVDDAVREAAAVLEGLGAKVEDVSMPMHALGVTAWAPVIIEGALELMFNGDALGTGWRGLYVSSMGKAHSAWRSQANAFPDLLKLGLLTAEYVIRNYGRHYYAKAQNLARRLRDEYDRVLGDVDLLLMPTNPMKAPPLPGPEASKAEQMYPGFDSVTNTAPFNVTGHPAMSIPVAMRDGLPVGMQLVARWHDEPSVYRAAAAFEAATDWHAR
ncbi:MAG TPA: amidase [Actinomycetota bacterium]|jgi:amidase